MEHNEYQSISTIATIHVTIQNAHIYEWDTYIGTIDSPRETQDCKLITLDPDVASHFTY